MHSFLQISYLLPIRFQGYMPRLCFDNCLFTVVKARGVRLDLRFYSISQYSKFGIWGFRNFLRYLKSLMWWNMVTSQTRYLSRNIAKCIGFPILKKRDTNLSPLPDWTVPKISLYLHPISAEDYMEPFLEFSSFSRYLGLFLMKFLMILEESSKSHQKSPRNRLKIEISKKGSVRSSTDGMKVLPILGTIQSPYSELQVTGTNFWTFYFYKNTQGSNSEKLRIS